MSTANPILNNPYEEPKLHYGTNLSGELDYETTMPGRRAGPAFVAHTRPEMVAPLRAVKRTFCTMP